MDPTRNSIRATNGGIAAARDVNINPVTVTTVSTIVFDPQKLADIINAISDCMMANDADPINDFSVINIDEKNEKNGISKAFYDEAIKEHYEYFSEMDKFFKNPSNSKFNKKFKHILTEVKAKIIARQNVGESMENIIATLFDFAKIAENIKLFNDNSYLADILAAYMYANCHIGRKT